MKASKKLKDAVFGVMSRMKNTASKIKEALSSDKGKKMFSVAILLIASIIWGLAFSAQKAAGSLGGFTVGAARNLFAVFFLIPIIPLMDKLLKNNRKLFCKVCPREENRKNLTPQGESQAPREANKTSSESTKYIWLPDFTRAELIGGTIAGFFMTFATALQQNGIGEGTDAGKAGFITALYVVIVPIYALFFGKKSPLKVWVSVVIAIVGFYFLSVKSNFTIVPSDLFILICAFVFAAQIMTIDLYAPRCDGVRLAFIQFLSGFIFNAICALIFESPVNFTLIGECILSLLFLGVFSSGIAYTFQVIGQRNLNPGVASILLSLESVFGAIGGALIFGEQMSPREIIGSLIVFFAVILSQIDFTFLNKSKNKSADL